MKRNSLVFAVLLLMAAPTIAWAQSGNTDTATADSSSIIQLGPAELIETQNTMSIITQEVLERKNADSLYEALRMEPGIMLNGNGAGFRGSSYINIRGFDQGRIGMFLDGIPLANGWGREFDFARISIFDVSSIEVSKGYSSPLLGGANNMGAVIDIRTAKPEKPLEFMAVYKNQFDRSVDDMGREFGASVGSRQDKFYLKSSFHIKHQDFFTPSAKAMPAPGDRKGGRRGRSDTKDWQLNMMAGWTPTEDVDIMLGYFRHEGEKNSHQSWAAPGNADARRYYWPDWDTERIYLSANITLNEKSYFKGTVYYDEHRDTLWAWDAAGTLLMNFSSKFDDSGWGTHLEYGYTFNERHKLAVAANYRADTHERLTPDGDIKTQDMKGHSYDFGAEYTVKPIDPLTMVFGLSYITKKGESYTRQDVNAAGQPTSPRYSARNKPEHDAFNWQFGAFYNLTPEHQVHFTFSRKTNLPTYMQMYDAIRLVGGVSRMAAEMKPEVANHFEFGYKGNIGGLAEISANVFYSQVKDIIGANPDYDQTDPDSFNYANIGEANFLGFEFAFQTELSQYVTLGSNFSYLKTHRKTTDAATSNMVVDKPKYMTNAFMIISPVKQWRIIPSIQVVGARYNLDHEKLLPSFVRVDLKTTYDITENISVQAGVENIGDVNYGYSGSTAAYGRDTQPGRNYFMGMSYIY